MKLNPHSKNVSCDTSKQSFDTLSVMMLVPFYPNPIKGGLERQAHELSKALLQSEISVFALSTKFTLRDKNVDLLDGVTVYRLPYPKYSGIRFVLLPVLLFLSLCKLRKRIDVIHVHQYSWFGLFSIIVAKLLRKPVITKLPNVGERGIPGLHKGLLGWLKIAILKSSDAIVAMSKQSLIELQEIGFPLERTLLTPNGISLNAPFREGTSISDKEIVNVVYVGRLTPQKGIEDLLYAWETVSRSKLPARLKIWGTGESRSDLEDLVNRLQIQHSVEFCGHVDDVPAKLTDMDIFVLPSYIEGNSNAVLEAMRAGLPVVATRVGGTEMQVGPEGAGFLVAPGSPEEIADRLVTLIGNASLRQGLGQAMRDRVSRFFDIHLVANTYMQAYALLSNNQRDRMIALANPVIRESGE
jgi:glycosyltransferase involved in cell wall biosynthesis